jgi:hypothetical protein
MRGHEEGQSRFGWDRPGAGWRFEKVFRTKSERLCEVRR